MKKWEKIGELYRLILQDSTLSNCPEDLKYVTYAPNIGYRSWIFRYKGVLVALDDAGNGHYDFYTAVSFVDVLLAKLMVSRAVQKRLNKI
jgi:hypothetical protein